MEQQTIRIRQILNTFPKAALIEMLLAQEVDTPTIIPTIEQPIAPAVRYVAKPYTPKPLVTRRKWTQAQDEALIYAVKQGRKSYREIGQLLGRTHKATCQRAVILRNRGLL